MFHATCVSNIENGYYPSIQFMYIKSMFHATCVSNIENGYYPSIQFMYNVE